MGIIRTFRVVALFIFSFFLETSVFGASQEARTIESVRSQLQQATDSLEILDLQSKLSFWYSYRDLDSMEYFLKEAYLLSRRLGERAIEAKTLAYFGIYYMEIGNPYLSYKYVNEGVLLSKTLKEQDLISELEAINAFMLIKEGKVNDGKSILEKVYSRRNAIQSDSIRRHITISYLLSHGPKITSEDLATLSGLIEGVGTGKNSLAPYSYLVLKHNLLNLEVELKKIDRDVYKERLLQVIDRAEKQKLNQVLVFGNLDLAKYSLERDPPSARGYFEKAIQLAEANGYEALQFAALSMFVAHLDQDAAQSKLANQLRSKMLAMQNARVAANKDQGVDFQRFIKVDNELKVKEKQSKISRIWILVLVLIVVAVLIFLYAISRQYRLKRNLAAKLVVMNGELEEKNRRLEENEEFHKKLISMMSHDLRQPFSMILMMSDRMIEELDREQIQMVMSEIKQSAAVSLQTMDGLLNWMRMQIMRLETEQAPTSLIDSFEKAMQFNAITKTRKGVSIEMDMEDQVGAMVPSEMLLFINRNILLNALNYSPEKGIIRISAKILHDQKFVIVEVSDQGKGLSDQALKNLFKKDRSHHESNHGGAGVSMIICDEMIRNFGGKIWAENNMYGGASFFYQLPYGMVTVELKELNMN